MDTESNAATTDIHAETLRADVLAALIAASRTFTESLEQAMSRRGDGTSGLSSLDPQDRADVDPRIVDPVWDPLTDRPLLPPKVVGTREEQDWCCLTYLGSLWATNVREGRGANRDEIREFAVKAGYRDGRAVTAWSKGNGATRNDDDKQRWMTGEGKSFVVRLADQRGVQLPPDLLADAQQDT